MPMYDYRCKKCGHTFEELVFSWDRDKEIVCPRCSAKELEQLMGAPATIGSSSGNLSGAERCDVLDCPARAEGAGRSAEGGFT